MKMDHENPKPWMGYDMNSLDAGREAIQTAQELKGPVASDPTPLVNGKTGIIIYYPLNIPLLYSLPNTIDRLSGVLTASYDVERIFTSTLSRSASCNNVEISVYDRTQPSDQPFFVYAPPNSDSLYDFTSYKTINMVNRKLEIVCQPIVNSVNEHRRHTVLPTIILVLTLIITLLFTLISFCFGKKYESTRKKGEVSQKELVESRRIVDSLARYSDAIVKFLPDPLLFIGPQKIKGANVHFLKKTGHPLDGLLGRDITDIIASFSHSEHIGGNSFKTDVRCADGTSFAAEISISEGFTDSSIEVPRYVMLIRDLTESKRVLQDLSAAKCEAQKANLAKTEILYFLCHEIRNPVHVILGLCSADDNLSDSKEARREMFIAAKFLGSLVDDILSLLNVKVGLLPVRKSEKNLNSLIFALWEEVKSLTKGKQLNFKLVLPPEGIDVDVLADEYRLHHGLIKVIEHSIRVTPFNGTVILSVESLNSSTEPQNGMSSSTQCQYRFILKDTSNGYSPSDIQKVFNPFDLDKSVSQGTEFGSFGLGLALAQKFLASIGAELRFSSVEGKGNHVTIDIPFERLPTAGSSTSIRTTRRTSQLSPSKGNLKVASTINQDQDKHEPVSSLPFKKTPTVLLVEDNAIVQKVTAKMLRKSSCHVITANNGEEAIDIISKENSIDVVLMDLIMPVLSGHDATVKLRSQNCQLPIIAVTANALDTEFERCKQEGFDDFVTKPATGETLSSIIQTWIGFTHDCSSSSHENM
ncbi:hypothetical protein BKA69DRAFT_411795 [Paraphysoderma sedebokerense]|nr:hypothetical protein BKA69DRAFT_411795 [Paraphysoderma sedebokerense]